MLESGIERARTKTVATVGPASESHEMLCELIRRGVDVFRINMAHGTREEHDQMRQRIRVASAELGRPVGILIDLSGPKIRLGQLPTDPLVCEPGAEYRFVRGEEAEGPDQLVSNYSRLVDELAVGNRVMLADGLVSMEVIHTEADQVVCRVVDGGTLRSRQGINLPGVDLSVPALTAIDRDNAAWAAGADIDFVGLSFVRSEVEIHELRNLLMEGGSAALVVAKIEKREALEKLEAIVQASDAVMVARGDLGVEIDVAETAVVQKRIISVCRQYSRPVIVATQMLDSMQRSPRPTRAEATDVANAVLDGADACMLSGETAIGEHPLAAVTMMNQIMMATEEMLVDRPATPAPAAATAGVQPVSAAVVYGAARIAAQSEARLVVVATHSGTTACVKGKQRDVIPTVAVSDSEQTLRQVALFWGVTPLAGAPLDPPQALVQFISNWGQEKGLLASEDRVVFVLGTELVQGAQNMVLVHQVP